MALLGVDCSSLWVDLQPDLFGLVWGQWPLWCSTLKYTGWTLTMVLPWWQHIKHCYSIIIIIMLLFASDSFMTMVIYRSIYSLPYLLINKLMEYLCVYVCVCSHIQMWSQWHMQIHYYLYWLNMAIIMVIIYIYDVFVNEWCNRTLALSAVYQYRLLNSFSDVVFVINWNKPYSKYTSGLYVCLLKTWCFCNAVTRCSLVIVFALHCTETWMHCSRLQI